MRFPASRGADQRRALATRNIRAIFAKRPLVEITIYENRPFIVRGPFKLQTADREETGSKRPTIALCRCGLSALKSFCGGNHVLHGASRNNRWTLSCAS